MGEINISRNRHKLIGYKIILIALSILTITVFPADAKKHANIETKSKSPCLAIPQDNTLHKNVVVIETNRWKPDKCMWIAKKEDLLHSKIDVVFPFEELFNAVCHIIVGVSDTHNSCSWIWICHKCCFKVFTNSCCNHCCFGTVFN